MRLWNPIWKLPWELHPALTSDRLQRVADVLRRTRDSAARQAKWGLGDDLWVIGCTAWKRATRALALAAAHEYGDWLSTSVVEHVHLIKIRDVPLRHFRGLADDPVPEKFRTATTGEELALALAFKGAHPLPGYLRFEISTTTKGFTKDVTFVVLNEQGERLHPWTIPVFAQLGRRRGAVELPRPGDERKDDTDDQSKGA